MTFAAPMFAWIAAGIAAATVALHLLAWRRPPETPLPTARFAPERPIRMVSRAIRPSDLALLALRVSIVMLVGVALAGPSLASRREGLARVVVADRSRADALGAVASTARGLLRPGDARVVFDSAAREASVTALDSAGGSAPARGSVSAGLVAGIRVARRLQRERDSVEIVVVSPFASRELDAATNRIRSSWGGAVRTLRAGAQPNASVAAARPTVRAPQGDAVAVALGLAGELPDGGSVRVVRDALSPADSAWAREGRAVVVWPMERGVGWASRPAPDTAFAVTAPSTAADAVSDLGAATVVAPFVRSAVPPAGRVLARWSDGEPAATEVSLGTGCLRAVAVPVPAVGDLVLTPSFRHFARRMAAPCSASADALFVSDSVLAAAIPATLPAGDRATVASIASDMTPSTLSAWLLALALAAALGEMWLRRGESNATG
jgi:hypothetical protein